jgi:hypothetical protein
LPFRRINNLPVFNAFSSSIPTAPTIQRRHPRYVNPSWPGCFQWIAGGKFSDVAIGFAISRIFGWATPLRGFAKQTRGAFGMSISSQCLLKEWTDAVLG